MTTVLGTFVELKIIFNIKKKLRRLNHNFYILIIFTLTKEAKNAEH